MELMHCNNSTLPHINDLMDEVMEEFWLAKEDAREIDLSMPFIKNLPSEMAPEILDTMVEKGFALKNGAGIQLTAQGEQRSLLIIRRHRLAERLLHEILDIGNTDEVDTQACLMEHILTERVTESICKFLGHPTLCPHGKIIPGGECCKTKDSHLTPYIRRLCDFNIGESGVISFIASENHDRISHLAALGLYPNAAARLIQKKPAYILEINKTTLSIDSEISKEIFLRA